MRLNHLHPAPGSKHPRRRLGRGNASGQGTTAGKGTKGEKARSGGIKSSFRGMSSRNARLGKAPGFKNVFKVEYVLVNVADLERFDPDTVVDVEALRSTGLAKGAKRRPVKLLGDGEITRPLTIRLDKVTQSARQKIERAGGRVEEKIDGTGSA